MTVDPTLRRRYGDEIRALGALHGVPGAERVIRAFEAVPREAHVGPGPWTLTSPLHGMARSRTPDADPAHLYHCVLIALDPARGINIGEPSLWARLLSRAGPPSGARVLQVGAGSSYFTAVLAELVGPRGAVVGYETDPALAAMAERALAERPNVLVRAGDATRPAASDGPFDFIVAFAGVTHPVRAWAEALAPGGTLLLPVTGASWWGAFCRFTERDGAFDVETLGGCGFYPCAGARDAAVERQVEALFQDPSGRDGARLSGRWTDGRFLYEAPGS
ncbi:MAG: methyltransferase domain-containing protein [Alphaproteobacteria bacterium]|nr:methyltransferase domain-containing protein [Alphaproteobacteria bacterium]